MAQPERTLDNPVTGERLVFRRTTADTNGEALEYELVFKPQGFVVQEHLHPHQSERHEVIAGELGLCLPGGKQVLRAGDAVDVPAATPHRLFAVGDERVHALFELRPALRSEELLRRFFRLAQEGKVNAKGMPGLLELALIARDFEPEGYATKPPLAVQRALLGPLAMIARNRTAAASPAPYLFVDEWDVAAPREAVFDALADGSTYPEWWRPVYLSVDSEGPPEVGRVSRQHFKGRLPYTLKTRSTLTALDRPSRIEVDVVGDLSGPGIWTLTEKGEGTHVRFDWEVTADRPLLRYLTPVLRPLFRWNHNWAIARAIEGLEPYARRQTPGS